MSKICAVCSYHCEDNATFCPACGSPLSTTQAAIASQSPIEIQPQEPVSVQPVVQPQEAIQVQPVVQPQETIQVQPVVQPQEAIQVQPVVQPQEAIQVQPVVQPQETIQVQPVMQQQTFAQPQPDMQQQTVAQPQSGMQQQTVVQPQSGMQQQTVVQPQSGIQQQTVVQPQPGMQQQTVAQPQPGIQQPYVQFQQNMSQQPYAQAQPAYIPQEPPKKKSHKTLWIVLGIIGGVILILIILLVVLVFVFAGTSRTNQSLGNSSSFTGFGSDGNYHEYYYPEYDNASFNSESFVDATTEAVTTPSATTSDIASFKPEDRTLLAFEGDTTTEPVTFTIAGNSSFTIESSGELADSTSLPTEMQGKQYQLGRGVGVGTSIDDVIATYGVDTTNAIWQIYDGNTYEYFYYSTTTKPENGADAGLLIGWYCIGETWYRMSPSELYKLWSTGTPPACDALLLQQFYTDETYTVDSITIGHGIADYFTIDSPTE